jgi:hypothetical protein
MIPGEYLLHTLAPDPPDATPSLRVVEKLKDEASQCTVIVGRGARAASCAEKRVSFRSKARLS